MLHKSYLLVSHSLVAVQSFSRSVVSYPLWPHGLQHARPHSLCSGVHSNSCHWVDDTSNHLILCHPLFLLSSMLPSIRVFSNESAHPVRWQNIRASASASVLPMNIGGSPKPGNFPRAKLKDAADRKIWSYLICIIYISIYVIYNFIIYLDNL